MRRQLLVEIDPFEAGERPRGRAAFEVDVRRHRGRPALRSGLLPDGDRALVPNPHRGD
jgi:hypothetical protein